MSENGMPALELCEPHEVDRAAALFHRDGFVVIRDALDAALLQRLRVKCECIIPEIVGRDTARGGNRGSHRYSIGSAFLSGHASHEPEWAALVALPTVTPILSAIWGDGYHVSGMGGDFCLPGATTYQPLHSDTGGTVLHEGVRKDYRDAPVAHIAVNFLAQGFTPLNGPLRQIPGTEQSHERIPPLPSEPEGWKLSTLCPAPAGSAVIRDLRAWHGGTPNVSHELRAMPNVEYHAPWFSPEEGGARSMPRSLFATLSPEAQRICARIVADDADIPTGLREELRTPFIFVAPRAEQRPPDPESVLLLPGETQDEYHARQTRLQSEARERMRAKFGGGLATPSAQHKCAVS